MSAPLNQFLSPNHCLREDDQMNETINTWLDNFNVETFKEPCRKCTGIRIAHDSPREALQMQLQRLSATECLQIAVDKLKALLNTLIFVDKVDPGQLSQRL